MRSGALLERAIEHEDEIIAQVAAEAGVGEKYSC